MSEPTYTKGPWGVDFGTGEVEDRSGRFRVVIHGDPTPYEELMANLVLIAAAPDLLDALKAIRDDRHCCEVMRRRANTAIAKAEGR